MSAELIFFLGFNVFIVAVLLLDLLVIGGKSHEVSIKEATIWSVIWIGIALLFAVFLRFYGELVHGVNNMEELKVIAAHYTPFLELVENDYEKSIDLFRKYSTLNYLSGYLIEKSLSVDNLFVMMLILTGFSVHKTDYKKILFWGILGAIVLRFIFIFAGAALIDRFSWILYIFGAYLIYAGIKTYLNRNKEEQIEPKNHPLLKFLSKHFKIHQHYIDGKFFVRVKGVLYLTPLFIVLIIIEFTDLIFALDSIPAIFSVTRDPYLVFFSNIFAILGLRSLFFLLIKVVEKFYLLKVGVSLLLLYVGLKLLFHNWLVYIHFKPVYSLYFILLVLTGSVVLSLIFPKKNTR